VTNYYVYYRVDAARIDAVGSSVQKLFKTIESETGILGRWMHRRDDPSTYMEVYEGVADDKTFEAVLEREAAGLGLERRVERFVCA
jgi:Domain of unknown function (DUF4936)